MTETPCPHWCITDHDREPDAPHVSDWNGDSNDAGDAVLSRARILPDGTAVVDLAITAGSVEQLAELSPAHARVLVNVDYLDTLLDSAELTGEI